MTGVEFALAASVLASPPPECQPNTYVIQPGDSYWKVAVKCDIPFAGLLAINPSGNPDLLHPGQIINLRNAPGTGGRVMVSPPEAKAEVILLDGSSPDQARNLQLIDGVLNPKSIELKPGWYRIKTNGQPWQATFEVPDAQNKTLAAYSVEQLGELRVDGWTGPNRVKPKAVANGADGNKLFTKEGSSTMMINTTENRGGPEGGTDWLLFFDIPGAQPNEGFPVIVRSQLR